MRVLASQALAMQVVGEAETWPALDAEVRVQRPDLVIVAWDLPAADEVPPLAALRSSVPDLRIVVLGLRPEQRRAALAAGADDFISTVDAPDVVVRVLQRHTETSPHTARSRRDEGDRHVAER